MIIIFLFNPKNSERNDWLRQGTERSVQQSAAACSLTRYVSLLLK